MYYILYARRKNLTKQKQLQEIYNQCVYVSIYVLNHVEHFLDIHVARQTTLDIVFDATDTSNSKAVLLYLFKNVIIIFYIYIFFLVMIDSFYVVWPLGIELRFGMITSVILAPSLGLQAAACM